MFLARWILENNPNARVAIITVTAGGGILDLLPAGADAPNCREPSLYVSTFPRGGDSKDRPSGAPRAELDPVGGGMPTLPPQFGVEAPTFQR